jgi:hypothetical protein
MIHKNRANRRRVRYNKSKRKYNILKDIYKYSDTELAKIDLLSLSKAKVHCSCSICAVKSNQIMGVRCKSDRTLSLRDRRNNLAYTTAIEELIQQPDDEIATEAKAV